MKYYIFGGAFFFFAQTQYLISQNTGELDQSILMPTPCPTCSTNPLSTTDNCNLVCNGNFEYKTGTGQPQGTGGAFLVNGLPYDPIQYVCSWQNGSNASPDFFHSGSTGTFGATCRVPNNYAGTQTSHNSGTSNGYAGFYAWGSTDPSGAPNYHEYIYQKLRYPLVTGVTYQATMWVSLAEQSKFATNNIGMYFSSTPTYFAGYGLLSVIPQITSACNYPGAWIVDRTNNWVKITGTIVGSGEQYLTIGGFDNNSILTGPLPWSGAYYYLDEVSVAPVTFAINAAPNPVCLGNSILLSANNISSSICSPVTPYTSVNWSSSPALTFTPPSGGTSSATPSAIGSATITATATYNPGCTQSTSITLQVKPVPATPSTINITVCAGATINLTTQTIAGATYNWTGPNFSSTLQNPTRPNSTVSMSGTYYVFVTVGGCKSAAGIVNVMVNAIPSISATATPNIICIGSSSILSALPGNGISYTWQPGGQTGSPQVTPGIVGVATYTVTGIDANGCKGVATTTITVDPCEESSTCCKNLENLIVNSDFSYSNVPLGFNSGYIYDNSAIALGSLSPTEFSIINSNDASIICPLLWNSIKDHSTCQTTSNGDFMIINGNTGQTIAPKKLVWEQTTNVQEGKEYKFCAQFKNLPQCCFDVLPKIDIKFLGVPGSDLLNQTINTTSTANCGWLQLARNFSAINNNPLTIQIWLDESSLGDGNDLAIDDIAFYQLPSTNPSYSAFWASSFTNQSGTLSNITFSTLALPPSCSCAWEVCQVDPITDQCKPNTTVYNNPLWWSIPTYCTNFNFAGYDGTSTSNTLLPFNPSTSLPPGVFDLTKTYRIRRGVWCECSGWVSTSRDLFRKNNSSVVVDSETKKIIQKFPIKNK